MRANQALKAALKARGLDLWSEDPDERETIRYMVAEALGVDVMISELSDDEILEVVELLK